MPKELFNQDTYDELEDSDRVAFGQPDVSGAKNVLWSTFLTLIASAIDFTTSILNLTTTSSETPSGNATTQQAANIEFTGLIEALQDEVANLASAAAYIEGDATPVLVTTTETTLSIAKTAEETDTDVIEVDETNNLIYLKQAGTYTFLSVSRLTNTSNSTDHTVYVRARDYDNDSLVSEREITATEATTTSNTKLVTITITEATTIYLTFESTSDTAVTLEDYTTNVATNSATGSGISHATADGYGYVSKDGGWVVQDEVAIATLGSSSSTLELSMDNLYSYYVNLGNTLEGTLSVSAPTNTATARTKEVVINNSTGASIDVNLTADFYESGISATQSFPDGQTRIYFKYINNLVFVGLGDIESSIDLTGYATEQAADLTNSSNVIDIDCNSYNNFVATNRVDVAADATITLSNEDNVRFITFKVNITNTSTLTFPTGSISPDDNWDTLIWTPPEDGYYTISIYKTSTEYEVIFTQGGAV